MIFDHEDYRKYLRSVLVLRIQKNARYSLRAFAKSLKLSHTTLSLVLSGKKSLSEDRGFEIADCLQLSPQETKHFIAMIRLSSAPTQARKKFLQDELSSTKTEGPVLKAKQLNADEFSLLSDWKYFAIMQMFNLKAEVNDKAIVARFKLHPIEAKEALDLLERLGMIKFESGRYSRIQKSLSFEPTNRNAALTRFYHAHLKKAESAIETQTADARVAGWKTMALSKAGVSRARELTYQYLDDLAKIAESDQDKSDIYHFLTHGFKVEGDF